ncbi:hypothetical protein ABPG75_012163 [Micractinium tetrahymenae]
MLACTGLALTSCGSDWAGIIVNDRLGFAPAASLGYCAGEEACSVSGHYCTATASACCSKKCGRVHGSLGITLGTQNYPFKTFDGSLDVEYVVCIGPAPPVKQYGADFFLFDSFPSAAVAKTCDQLKASTYLIRLRQWLAGKAGVAASAVSLKTCKVTTVASAGRRLLATGQAPDNELSMTLSVSTPTQAEQISVASKLQTELLNSEKADMAALSQLAVDTDMGSFTIGGLGVEILNAPAPCVRPGLGKTCIPGAPRGSAQRCCGGGDEWHGKHYWDTDCKPVTAGGPNICSCPKSCIQTEGPFWCWCQNDVN